MLGIVFNLILILTFLAFQFEPNCAIFIIFENYILLLTVNTPPPLSPSKFSHLLSLSSSLISVGHQAQPLLLPAVHQAQQFNYERLNLCLRHVFCVNWINAQS